jgi:hypothetical protein
MSDLGTSIVLDPLIDWLPLYILGGVALAAVVLGAFLRARGTVLRLLAAALVWLIVANPSLVVENREPLKDVAVVVVDESVSQSLDGRDNRTAEALAKLRQELGRFDDLDVRIVRAGNDPTAEGTRLFEQLERVLGDIPRKRLAGVVFLSDGVVHDAPTAQRMIRGIGPVHVLLSGRKDEKDRRLVVVSKPSYGLLGKPLQMVIKVDEPSAAQGTRARLTIKRDGKQWKTLTVPVGRDVTLDFELDHPGTTFFEMEVAGVPNELTLENNRRVVTVNGIRDRLRVLLISGQPHPGERAWRNLLKADPGVDLVHFTILRPPEKRDMTPVNELALISFPVRELFEEKLDQFHLIIFDRYRRRGVIRTQYLENIADYIKKGGALLVAAGPDFAGALSLSQTPIGPLLPAQPTGDVLEEGFRAARTEVGTRHPVTASLPGGTRTSPWGRWFRQIDATARGGQILMTGTRGKPLLILDRVEKGRVALLLSDQIWLWDRGFDGGGPQAEVLRRLSHWLMKEPELEENYLSATIQAGRLTVRRRTLEPTNRPVRVTGPDGKTVTVPMTRTSKGVSVGRLPLTLPGLYRITDGELSTMTAIGSLNPVEMENVRTTEARMRPAVAANGGSILWMSEDGVPALRRVAAEDRMSGGGGLTGAWIGLKRNGDYVVTGIRDVPLMVGFIALLLALLPLMGAWRREGK